MWSQLLTWLRKPPVEEPIREHVARLISGLFRSDPATRSRADSIVAGILADDAG